MVFFIIKSTIIENIIIPDYFQEYSFFWQLYYIEIQEKDEETFSGGEKAPFCPKMEWNGPLDNPHRGSEEVFTSEYWLVVLIVPICSLLGSDVVLKPHLGSFHHHRVKIFIWGPHSPLLTFMMSRMLYRTCMEPQYWINYDVLNYKHASLSIQHLIIILMGEYPTVRLYWSNCGILSLKLP